MSVYNDNVTVKLGCGEERFFASKRNYLAWHKTHKKKCSTCASHNRSVYVNVSVSDSVGKRHGCAKDNYMDVKHSMEEAMKKGDALILS